jgi:protein-disulfide isomerase
MGTATPHYDQPAGLGAPPRALATATDDDRSVGPEGAAATLVVYGNYSCLQCRRAYDALADLAREAGDGLRVVYRHFARPADFPDAERAAEAACAAAAQGRFWAMHLRLATGAPFFDDAALVAQATDLGLDVHRFADDLRRGRYRERVRGEHAAAAEGGVAATPTFFLNGVRFEERWDLDALRAAVLRVSGRAERVSAGG